MQNNCNSYIFSDPKNDTMERIASQENTKKAFSESGINSRCWGCIGRAFIDQCGMHHT